MEGGEVRRMAPLSLSAGVEARARAECWMAAMGVVRWQGHVGAAGGLDRARGGRALRGWLAVGGQHAGQRKEEEHQSDGRCLRFRRLSLSLGAAVVEEAPDGRLERRVQRALPAVDAQTYRHRLAAGARRIWVSGAKGRVGVLAVWELFLLLRRVA